MHKHVGHPGTWQQFLKRSDNNKITIEEARQKYLKEQYFYDRWMATSQPTQYSSAVSNNVAFVGQGIDGPISGATVKVFDSNGNHVISTTTNSVGAFTLDFVPAGEIIIEGGTDTVTGIAFTGTLKAPVGSSVISPITTAIKEVMDLGNTEADATNAVFDMAREIYGIDIDSSVYDQVKTENFITLAETDANFLKVTGFASFLESSAEVTGEQVNQQFSDETLKSGKEAFYKSLAGQANTYKTAMRPGSGTNFDSFGVGSTTGRSIRQNIVRLVGYSGRPGNLNWYNTIEPALQVSLDRVREVVNDANIDKNYGMTTVMTQNRIAKRDLKSEITAYGGSANPLNLNASASRFVQQNETAEAENLGTIFSGKTNRKAPTAAKLPVALSYISGSEGLAELNFGDLNRVGDFNGTAQYTGVVQGEATLVWYDTTNRSWVIDNNLTLPAIATAVRKQVYPLSGQAFNTTDGREIRLFTSGSTSVQTAPAGSGRYLNSFYSRGATKAVEWTSVGEASTSGGVTTRTAQGTIRIQIMDLGQTIGNFKGANPGILLTGTFTITNNVGSQLYVISHNESNTILNINGAGNQTVTRLSLGITLTGQLGQPTIDTTGGFNPTIMNNIAGIVET